MDSAVKEQEAAGPKPTLVLRKARRILDAFTAAGPELALADIRAATGLPTTTCARLVANLVDEGLLDRAGDRYRIGLGVLRWSAAAVRGLDLVTLLQPLLDDLRDRTGESAALFVPRDGQRTCVAVAPTRHSVIWQLQVGMVTPLHVGSGGRAILAFDADVRDAVLAGPRTRFTRHTIVGERALRAALARTRRTGVAVSEEELDRDVAGVSAPVFAAPGRVVGAIGVAGPAQRFGPDAVAAHVPAVLATARRACTLLGAAFPIPEEEPR